MEGIVIVYDGLIKPSDKLIADITALMYEHCGGYTTMGTLSITTMDENDIAKAIVGSVVVKTKIEQKKDVLNIETHLKHFVDVVSFTNVQDKEFLSLLTRTFINWSQNRDLCERVKDLKSDIDVISKIPSRGHDYELAKTYGFTSNIIASIRNLNGAGIFDL